MAFLLILSLLSCDHPAKVDIGELVEALNALDADEAADADELADDLTDEDVTDNTTDLSGEDDSSESDVTDSTDTTDAVEVEPDEDPLLTETEIEADVDLSDEGVAEDDVVPESDVVPDEDAVVLPSNVICTGQTKCYDNTTEITCPTGGTDFYGQDAQYAALGYCVPRDYTVTGTTPEEIVVDNNTGLEWQRTVNTTAYIWDDAIAYCDNLSYGDYTDWRLPTRTELATLPDYGRYNPAIDTAIFPDTQSPYYWTSSSVAGSTDGAWGVSFSYSNVSSSNKADTYYARCVRGDPWEPVSAFTEETVSGKVIVIDTVTGFQWTKEYSEAVTWQNALAYCENLTYASHTDWRLPNIEELETLIDDTIVNPASTFPVMPSEYFWSSSSCVYDADNAWYVGFFSGNVESYDYKTSTIYARCVRNSTLTRTTKQWGTSATENGRSVAIDSSGNIFVTGFTTGSLDGNTNLGSTDIFLTKWLSDGTKAWTKQLGTTAGEGGYGVATDDEGNIFVTGVTYGDLDGNTSAGERDIFLTKWTADGTKAWTKQWGTELENIGYSVAVDGDGNIFVTGTTRDSLDGNPNLGASDIFLTKWNPDGTKAWTKQWGSTAGEIGYGVAVDGSGNIFVTGQTQGSFDGNANMGGTDIFLTKWNADGSKAWTKIWGTNSENVGNAVAVDASGNIFVTGQTGDAMDGNTLVGARDIFLTKWNAVGEKQWTKQWGTTADDFGESVAIDAYGNAFVTGYTNGALDGNVSGGADDIFLTKWNSNGVKQWTKQWGGALADVGFSVKVGTNNNIYVAGGTWGTFDGNTFLGEVDAFLSILEME